MSEQPESSRPRKRQRRLVRPGGDSDDDSETSSISISSRAPITATEGGGDSSDQEMAPAAPPRGPQLLQADSDDEDNAGEDSQLPRRLLGRRMNANAVGAMLAGNGGGGDPDENESEGEDLQDNDERDYRAIPELDRYADADLDDEEDYDPISSQARQAAERVMGQRDAEQARRGVRMPGALADSSDDDDDDDDNEEGQGAAAEAARRRRMRARLEYAADGGNNEDYSVPPPVEMDLQNLNLPLREAIQRPEVQAEVKRRFREFLSTFEAEEYPGKPVYFGRIKQMCARNDQSLLVSYADLIKDQTVLAVWLAEAPREMLELLDTVGQQAVLDQFPEYAEIHEEIFVRVTDLPIADVLRDLRTTHLGVLIKVSGVVTRRTHVVPELKMATYRCRGCQHMFTTPPNPVGQVLPVELPTACENCDAGTGAFELDAARTIYRNFQIVSLQESPGTVPAGRVPRYKSVYVSGDLIDLARPGEEVEITGIYENMLDLNLNSQNGFPVFSTRIVANYIQKKEDVLGNISISEEDKAMFRNMAKDPRIGERVIGSVAPSIYGCRHVKTALAMALFGGREKNINDKHRVRGDINVLLMGDPGTAKSQCLKYCEKTAPRAVYTTGKGASAVGLTAAVHKDPITREWTLEGGALVLADKGVCLIDEFDKMNDKDRTSIHEAMEQQSISISKAGIVTTLQARCSVIAAANPIGGRYDPQRSFAENVELTDPIIQRFDILCVLQDTVDPMADERLAKFVVGSHVRSHPGLRPDPGMADADMHTADPAAVDAVHAVDVEFSDNQSDEEPPGGYIPQEMLKKYVLYARSLKPVLHAINQDKVAKLYGELRRESVNSGGVPIAVRHIESIMRMSEAYARMHLREHVRDDDVDMAIRVMLESFISAQKYSAMRAMRRKFHRYLTFNRDNDELVSYLLEEMVKDQVYLLGLGAEEGGTRVEIPVRDLALRARELGIHDLAPFLSGDTFRRRRFTLEGDAARLNHMTIVKIFA